MEVPGNLGPAQPMTVQLPATVEELESCLNHLRKIRATATQYLTALAEGQMSTRKHVEDDEEKDNNKKILDVLIQNNKIFQNEVNALSSSVGPNYQNYLEILALDSTKDRYQLYQQVRQCYTWTDKVQEYNKLCHSLVHHSALHRSQKRKKTNAATSNVNASTEQVDTLMASISQKYQDMNFALSRPEGSNTVVQVTLGRVLKGAILLRGLLIESVVIRSYSESNLDKNGKVDLFTPSSHQVFQRVTDNATAAMLHFCSPYLSDLSIKSFFTWLHSYSTLFSGPCYRCGVVCAQNQPPTWREFLTLQAFHQHCRS